MQLDVTLLMPLLPDVSSYVLSTVSMFAPQRGFRKYSLLVQKIGQFRQNNEEQASGLVCSQRQATLFGRKPRCPYCRC